MTPLPPTGAFARNGLPIVIGLEASADADGLDASALGRLLEEEFRSRRQRYPHSPFVLLTRAPTEILAPAHAAAAAAGMRVVAYDSASACTAGASAIPTVEFGVLADLCHVLITVAPADRARPAQALPARATAVLDHEEPVVLAAEFRVELVRLRYATAQSGHDIEIFRTPDEQRPSLHAMQRTDEFNRDSAASPAPHFTVSDLFDAADRLARDYQKKLRRAFLAIFWIAVLMTISYGVFTQFSKDQANLGTYVLAFYALLLIMAYAIYYVARRSDIHNRFIEYRALAEGARVQQHWIGCGIARNAADDYLERHPVELHWIRLALRSAVLFSEVRSALPAVSAEQELTGWIADQRHYFAASLERSRRSERQARYFVIAIFALGGFAWLVSLLPSMFPLLLAYQNDIGFLGILCPAVATAVVALVNKLGMLYQVRHYSRMLEIFARAESYVAEGAPPSLRTVALALGQEALRESGNWLLFRRDRGLDQPASPFRRPSW